MSEIRTSHVGWVTFCLMILSLPTAICQAATWKAILVTDKPTRYSRTLAIDSRGKLWASFMKEQGLETWGIGRIDPASSTLIPMSALFAHHVFDLKVTADQTVIAATDNGLRMIASDGKIESEAEGICITMLAAGADGVVLGAGIGGDGALHLVRRRKAAQSLEQWRYPVKGPGKHRDLLRLFERPDGTAVIVTSKEIVLLKDEKLAPLALAKTPLATTAEGRSEERRVPPVWLYDATMTSDGSVYCTGFSKRLVKWWNDRFEIIAEGHFQELAPGDVPGTVWATDFNGALWKWDGGTFALAFSLPGGHIQSLRQTASGSVWLECAPASGPHRLVRISDTPMTSGAETRWAETFDAGVPLNLRPGLLSPGILSLTATPDGCIVIATNAGIWRLQPENH
ncbi:MAG TPA: hypothetical protein PKM25_11290 [Candidatus Ozemobacteraceae bacterium]|mgnify:CR=1 FL=1|nr:hypothetical protein [Candidatus Ozemobacteraceae bacterium]